jgi:uncharacterized integral membrane protein
MTENGPVNDVPDDGASSTAGVGDIVLAVGFLIFSILMFIGATQFTWQTAMGFVTSAAFTPLLLSVLVAALSVVLIIETIGKNRSSALKFRAWLKDLVADETVRRSFVLVVATGIYTLLVGRIPFLLVNFIYLLIVYYYLKIGKLPRVFVYSVANALLIAYVIPYIYQMPLP